MTTTTRYNRRKSQRDALQSLGLTEKYPTSGHNVSHAMNKTKRTFKPNMQSTTVLVDGKQVSLRLDARTIRTLTKVNKQLAPGTKPKPKTAKVVRPKSGATATATAKKATAKK